MRHILSINLVLIVGLGLVSILLQSLSKIGQDRELEQTAILTVCPPPDSTCDYTSIQSAVDAANDGDMIKVASGIFSDVHSTAGVSQVVYITKSITIQGGYTVTNWTTPDPETNLTILNAYGNGRILYITGNITPTIEGVHIVNGTAAGLGGGVGGKDAGGGVYVDAAAATISNSQIYNNEAVFGGGLYFSYSNNATLTSNTIASNTGKSKAGGIFFQNSAKATLTGNTISNNKADMEEDPFGNKDYGGVFFLSSPDAVLANNIIKNNIAANACGGLCFIESDNATLVNNVIIDNQSDSLGNGLYISRSSIQLLQTTIARNDDDGNGIHINDGSTVGLTNTIIAGHQTGINLSGGSTANLDGVLWFGNTTNTLGTGLTITHAYTGDPRFMADGYHLTAYSEAIDKGVHTNTPDDIDDDPRPFGLRQKYDIGADEFSIIPNTPELLLIANSDNDGDYLVNWNSMTHAVTYTLEEDNNIDFLSPMTSYSGANTEFQVSNHDGGTWYYRVNASNLAGISDWSEDQSVVVTAYSYFPVIMKCHFSYFEGLWDVEPNDVALSQANGAIHSDIVYSGTFTSTADIKDYFYFYLCESHSVELQLTNIPVSHDYDLALRNSKVEVISKSENWGNIDERIFLNNLPPGLYFVQVYNFSKSASNQAYHLKVEYE